MDALADEILAEMRRPMNAEEIARPCDREEFVIRGIPPELLPRFHAMIFLGA